MIKKNARYEMHLRVIIFMVCYFKIMSFLAPDQLNLIFTYAYLGSAVLAIIKVSRFYKYANPTINAIWITSIMLTLSGAVLLFFGYPLGMGFGSLGITAFWLTWHFSFLANQPDIQ